jgi:hypothetical protein
MGRFLATAGWIRPRAGRRDNLCFRRPRCQEEYFVALSSAYDHGLGSPLLCSFARKGTCGRLFRSSRRTYGACKGDSLPIHPSGVTACQPLVCVKSLQKSVHGKMDTLCASSGAIWRGPCRLLCVPAVGVQHIGVHPDRRGHSTAYSRFPLSQADPGGPCILYIPHMGGFSRFRVTSRG